MADLKEIRGTRVEKLDTNPTTPGYNGQLFYNTVSNNYKVNRAGTVADGSTVTTAVAGNGYFIDTTSAAHTINLPASPSVGDEVSIIDASGTADTNNITVGRNSENIQGSAADLTISTERAAFTLVYFNSTQGWLLNDK